MFLGRVSLCGQQRMNANTFKVVIIVFIFIIAAYMD
jgi:hypothetical protein